MEELDSGEVGFTYTPSDIATALRTFLDDDSCEEIANQEDAVEAAAAAFGHLIRLGRNESDAYQIMVDLGFFDPQE